MKIIKLDKVVRIEHKSASIRDRMEFWDKVQELIKDGYVVKEPENVREAPKFVPFVRVDFIRPEDIEEKEEEPESVGFLKTLETLSKKEELLDFASYIRVEVPSDIVIPSAIKKYLKKHLTND